MSPPPVQSLARWALDKLRRRDPLADALVVIASLAGAITLIVALEVVPELLEDLARAVR